MTERRAIDLPEIFPKVALITGVLLSTSLLVGIASILVSVWHLGTATAILVWYQGLLVWLLGLFVWFMAVFSLRRRFRGVTLKRALEGVADLTMENKLLREGHGLICVSCRNELIIDELVNKTTPE
jgi:hypothetical protein